MQFQPGNPRSCVVNILNMLVTSLKCWMLKCSTGWNGEMLQGWRILSRSCKWIMFPPSVFSSRSAQKVRTAKTQHIHKMRPSCHNNHTYGWFQYRATTKRQPWHCFCLLASTWIRISIDFVFFVFVQFVVPSLLSADYRFLVYFATGPNGWRNAFR